MPKWWGRVCGFCLGSLALLSPITTVSQERLAASEAEPLRFSAEAEAAYRERYKRVYEQPPDNSSPGFRKRSPMEDVAGVAEFVPFPQATAPTISADALKAAEGYAADRNTSALIVWRNGAIELETYSEGGSRQSLFASGSLAKPLSVLAIGRALALGQIRSLNEPAANYITEWQGTPKAAIAVRHLLDMRSGLLPQNWEPDIDSVMIRANLHPFHEEIIINEYPLVNEPGTRYDYANVNSELVVPVIERATGKRYANWLSEQLLRPLGAQGGQLWLNRENGVAHAGGGLLFPADTYLRMAILVTRGGRWNEEQLLSESFVAAMKQPTLENPHAGMGVYIGSPYVERRGALNPDQTAGRTYHSEAYAADDLVLFDGNGNQVAYMVPSLDLVILRLGRWPARAQVWDNAFLPNAIIRGSVGD